MCDRCCQICWSKHFYRQYLEQHSAMMQRFHPGIQSYGGYLPAHNPAATHHFNTNQYVNNDTNQYVNNDTNQYVNNDTNQVHQYQEPPQWTDQSELIPVNQNQKKRSRQFSSSSSESSSEESEVSRDDIIGSDDEICFDPGCFLKLANNKESLSEKSDDDDDEEAEIEFEMVDSVIEEFEYVQLDRFGNMSENRKGRKGRPDAEREMKQEKEVREYLYGDKADTIAGLETAMSLDFNRLCDLYQPHLWPVLPVRLSKV